MNHYEARNGCLYLAIGKLDKTQSSIEHFGILYAAIHNEKIEAAIDFLHSNKQSFVNIDKGRTNDERSCTWIEKGHFYGMGYIEWETPITDITEIKDHVTLYKSNHYIMQLITSFIEKNLVKF